MVHLIRTLTLLGVTFVYGCASTTVPVPVGLSCETTAFAVSDDFAGARRGPCDVINEDRLRIHIHAEDDKVTNDSPWYAFKVMPSRGSEAVVEMIYHDVYHRYDPKISFDGEQWERLDESAFTIAEDYSSVEFRLPINEHSIYIAAQEIISPPMYDAWNKRIADSGVAELSEIGRSMADLPIAKLDTGDEHDDVLLIVGRQHPPEVSGAIAFFSFAETLFADTSLANEFRSRFRVIAVPLINPDGVIAGHWRHNLGNTDLNRDWGPFKQPETQAIQHLLDELDDGGAKLRVFADFHSTAKNLLYTQSPDTPTEPLGFTPRWLANTEMRMITERLAAYDAIDGDFADYQFTNEAAAPSEQANSKNYMYKRYGIPAVTFEVGDETNRDAIRAAAVIFAEELMRLMLQ